MPKTPETATTVTTLQECFDKNCFTIKEKGVEGGERIIAILAKRNGIFEVLIGGKKQELSPDYVVSDADRTLRKRYELDKQQFEEDPDPQLTLQELCDRGTKGFILNDGSSQSIQVILHKIPAYGSDAVLLRCKKGKYGKEIRLDRSAKRTIGSLEIAEVFS